MSDNYLRLIPTDPHWTPDRVSARRGLAALRELAPGADKYDADYLQTVTFVDQGGNLEEIRCPNCGRPISFEWFTQQMGRPAFDDLSATTPCCATPVSLNDLDFRWPAGFASFELSARNPGRRQLTEGERHRVELALGHLVREIWAHY